MGRIAGITYGTNPVGRKVSVTINLDRFKPETRELAELLDDFLDLLAIEEGKNEDEYDWKVVVEKENKRRGIYV
ncbi:hypothetical protein [Viscerimonas tarda]